MVYRFQPSDVCYKYRINSLALRQFMKVDILENEKYVFDNDNDLRDTSNCALSLSWCTICHGVTMIMVQIS